MKTLLFLVVIANVALFMWEFKTGAFVPVTEISEQNADVDQEPILLVSELKIVPQSITPAPDSVQPLAEPVTVTESSPVILKSIDKPTLEKSTTGNSNVSEITAVPKAILPKPVSEQFLAGNTPTNQAGKPALLPEPLPAISDSIEKPDLEGSPVTDTNISNADKIAEHCYEAGPFANLRAYKAWVNRLKDIKSEIKPIKRDDQIPSKYIVYYPAAETELESEANIKMLKQHGIKDLWFLTGEDKGKISLGLFIKEESALTMKNQLLAKGINTEVITKHKTKSQQYVLIKGDDRLMARLDDLKKSFPELAVKQVQDLTPDCVGK